MCHLGVVEVGTNLRMPPTSISLDLGRIVDVDDLRSFCHFEGETFSLGVRRFNFLNLGAEARRDRKAEDIIMVLDRRFSLCSCK